MEGINNMTQGPSLAQNNNAEAEAAKDKALYDEFVSKTGESPQFIKAMPEVDFNAEMTNRGFSGTQATRIRRHWSSLQVPPVQKALPPAASTWAVASTIGAYNYQVPLDKLAFPQLVKRAEERGCSLVQGSFRSGKSSHCEALEGYLNATGNYYCVRIPLSSIRMLGERRLSESSGVFESIRVALKPHLPSTYDMSSFSVQGALTVIKMRPEVKSKRLVVLWDEFQVIVGESTRLIRADVTEACRNLVSPSKDETVYSSLGFGTFQLDFLDDGAGNRQLSPFHGKPAIFMTPAGKSDMKKTILEWLADRNEIYEEAVIDAWIETSGGFLGIYSFIGYVLGTRSPTVGLTYQQWTVEYARVLTNMMSAGGTFVRMISSVNNASTDCKQQIRTPLFSDQPILVERCDRIYPDLMDMASAGVLNRRIVTGDKDEFRVSCTTIKHLVFHLFSPASPVIPDSLLADPKSLLARLLDQLLTENRSLNDPVCWKTGEFPTEVTFQSLIFSDIKQAFRQDPAKSNYIVLMETGQQIKNPNKRLKTSKGSSNSNKRSIIDSTIPKKRSDLFWRNGHAMVIELKSNIDLKGKRKATSKNDLLKKGVQQVAYYAKAQGLTTAVLLNIVSSSARVGSVPAVMDEGGVRVFIYQAEFSTKFTSWKWIKQQEVLQFGRI